MIHPSHSAWCNTVVLVWKKYGGLCFCIYFQCLNTHTKKDLYPLPRIQEALESLFGAGYFSCLDLKSWFLQIKMDKSSKQYTAFTTGNLCFFECNLMPFRLCNTQATFQQLIQNFLGELNLIYCLIYLDDIVIFLHTVEKHLHHLCLVLTNLESTIWNWSHQYVTFSKRKLPTWHIKSLKMECDPVIQTWRPLLSAHHLKPTQRCMPS